MPGGFRRPGTETVMVFGGVNHTAHTGVLEGAHDGVGIKVAGFEQLRRFIAIAPLPVCVGVESEMDEGIPFHSQPIYLLFCRQRAIGSGLNGSLQCPGAAYAQASDGQ